MTKVLRIINRFNIGGPTYNATFLTRYLSDEFETLLVGGLPEADEKDSLHILEKYNVTPVLIPEMKRLPNLKSDRAAYKRLKQIIEEFQPDIVHTHAAKAGALGRKAARACGVPVIVHTFHGHVFHSYFGSLKTRLYKVIERNLAKKSTGIIAISPLQKTELVEVHRIVSADKVRVIPLGFDLEQFQEDLQTKRSATRAHYNLSETEVAVAIVGRLAPIKNHRLFLMAVEKVLTEGINARFFIVGDGSEKSWIEPEVVRINTLFPGAIELTSWIKDIATFNAGMDVISLSSSNEGTPVSLIEAQAMNIPVLTTDVGGVRDIVLDGETGFIVPTNDIDSFSEKLSELIKNKEIREKMSQNGWNHVRDKFHYTTLVKNMENYYHELMEKQVKK